MGKSDDLIEKINARLKSNMSALSGRGGEGRSERGGRDGARDRRINLRGGGVVIRRRSAPPPPREDKPEKKAEKSEQPRVSAQPAKKSDEDKAPAAASPVVPAESVEIDGKKEKDASVRPEKESDEVGTPSPEFEGKAAGTVEKEEAVEAASSPVSRASDARPAEPARTPSPKAEVEASAPSAGESRESEEGSAAPGSDGGEDEHGTSALKTVATEGRGKTGSGDGTAIEHAEETVKGVGPKADAEEEGAEVDAALSARKPGRKKEADGTEARAGGAAADDGERAPKDAQQREQASERKEETRARSLEEVLAQEHGHIPVLRRAIVVRDASKEMARKEARPARSAGKVEGALGRRTVPPATRSGQKEKGGVLGEDRRAKERPLPRGVPPRGAGREEAERNRGGRHRKGLRRKEVFRGDMLGYDGEYRPRGGKRSGSKRSKGKTQLTTPKAIKRIIRIEDSVTVADLARRMGIKMPAVISKLMGLGVMATANQSLDADTASLVAAEFGYEVENTAFDESALIGADSDKPEDMVPRPPVVTIMGHVDHGKTTLLDAIRDSDVAAREAGGITQHIGAHTVDTRGGRRIVFLDTPGHEAFTAMRSRGAKVTDIVILVVAADDGVMPQTVEALNHARAAEVPIIVAVNKIDKPGADPERIKQRLAEHDLVPEEWGGQTIFCEVSAKEGTNIDELLELTLLQADILELKANPKRAALGTVIEAKLDKGRGPVATILVSAGTLKVGDIVVVGEQYGKIRAMIDDRGAQIKEALPATPVEILGLSGVPQAGDSLIAVKDLDTARRVVANRVRGARSTVERAPRATLEDLFSRMEKGETRELRIVLKTDVQGSLEALSKAITELSTDAVKTVLLHQGVGTISENDITLAGASQAIVIGFNVKADNKALKAAEAEGVQIKSYSVIYEVVDDIRRAMQGLLKPKLKEQIMGHAEVREIFTIPKVGTIAGSSVTDGRISRNAMARVVRDDDVVWEGRLASLKRFREDVREVEKGFECGIGLDGFNDVRLGDIIEVYTMEEVAQTL